MKLKYDKSAGGWIKMVDASNNGFIVARLEVQDTVHATADQKHEMLQKMVDDSVKLSTVFAYVYDAIRKVNADREKYLSAKGHNPTTLMEYHAREVVLEEIKNLLQHGA